MPNYNVPVWSLLRRAPRQYPWLDEEFDTGICVIGGGLAGVMCALRLAQSGEAVALVTSGQLGGDCARAMPSSEYDCGETLRSIGRRCGRDTAAELFGLASQAVSELEQLCGELGAECGFRIRDSLLFTDEESDLEAINREYIERRKLGFDCSYLSRNAARDVFSFPIAGAVLSKSLAAEVDPFMLAHALAARATELGVAVFENTRAERVERNEGRLCVECSTYHSITADQAIIASDSACAGLLDGIGGTKTSFTAVSRPVRSFRGWPGRCVIRSFSEPRLSIATSPDDRIFIKGLSSAMLDENGRFGGIFKFPSLSERKFEELSAAARYLFPDISIPSFEFFSAVREIRSSDGLPVVGRTAEQPECVFAACAGSGGVLVSELVSRLAVAEIFGAPLESSAFFSPERKKLAG